jgi:hypothetical protein
METTSFRQQTVEHIIAVRKRHSCTPFFFLLFFFWFFAVSDTIQEALIARLEDDNQLAIRTRPTCLRLTDRGDNVM